MCDNEERELSRQKFKTAETMVDFMKLWSTFYENKICIPTYLSKFIGAVDNPYSSRELGEKFREITIRGFLATDSQVTVPGSQKGYIVGFLPNQMAEIVASELNRYSGVVAFYSDIKAKESGSSLYVTYDDTEENIIQSAQTKKMSGDPFTSVGHSDPESFNMIKEWMGDKLQKRFLKDRYKYFVCITPCFDADPYLIFDKLLEVLRNI